MSETEDQSGDKEIGTRHICRRTFSTQEELSKHLMDEHAGESCGGLGRFTRGELSLTFGESSSSASCRHA